MVGVTSLFISYFAINLIRIVSLVSLRELPKNDIIIDIQKGYALRRIGVYSPNLIEQIVHTFVPLDNFCVASPKKPVCLYASLSTSTNVVELVTMMASRQTIRALSSHNDDSVSRLLGNDISRVLEQHHLNEIIKSTKSAVHFVNNQFHYQKSDEKVLTAVSSNNIIDNYSNIRRLPAISVAEKILKRISSNKIGFEYLSNIDLKLFLAAISSNNDTLYTNSNVRESLDNLAQLIIGQSIFILRYCSINKQNSLSSQPCLAISTLFLQPSIDSMSTFTIYRLLPLSIITNGDKYVYTNLPKLIGINSYDNTVIMWSDELDINECTLSPFVQCQQMPVVTSLSKSSCLSQLFNDNQVTTGFCHVSRSQNIVQDVINIANDIWLFYNTLGTRYCQIYSTSNGLSETVSINGPTIVRMPCDKTISCMDIQLTASSCVPHRVLVTPNFALNIRNPLQFIVPIQNMTQTLMEAYQLQSDKSIKDIITAIRSKQSTFDRITHDFVLYIFLTIIFIVFTIIGYIIKIIKFTHPNKFKQFESIVEDILNV